MPPSVTDETIRAEHARLRRLARETADVVYVGCRTGQLAVRFGRPRDGVGRAEVTRVDAPTGLDADDGFDAPQSFYHCVLRAADDADDADARRAVFRHPFPALEWLNETVAEFDLLEFVYVNEADGSDEESEAEFTDSG